MASANYKLCDMCGNKTFYDADLSYDFNDPDNTPVKEVGSHTKSYTYSLDHLGDWAVLCDECSKKYKTVIMEIEDDVPSIEPEMFNVIR